MSRILEDQMFAEDVMEGCMVETAQLCPNTGRCILPDTMHVLQVVRGEFGVMFYGTELLSGRRFFTVPVPPTQLITAWSTV